MQSLIAEFDHESTNTRKMLERVPDEHLQWKPHEKSYTLGKLATHIATMPGWFTMTVGQPELDLSVPMEQPKPQTRAEILSIFDTETSAARTALSTVTEDILAHAWTLRHGDHVIFTMPKSAVLRDMCFNHIVHHRGQLSVYLRLLDVPVPGLYGPSADER